MRRTAITITATAGLLLAALPGCSREDDRPVTLPSASSPPAATGTPAPAPTPTGAPKDLAVAAYIGMQNAVVKASNAGNADEPDIAKYADGDALKRLRSGIAADVAKGLRTRGEPTYQAKAESLAPATNPTTARVRDCMDTTKFESYKVNGEAYKDSPGGLRLVIATVSLIGSTWKVTGLGVHGVGSCTR